MKTSRCLYYIDILNQMNYLIFIIELGRRVCFGFKNLLGFSFQRSLMMVAICMANVDV